MDNLKNFVEKHKIISYIFGLGFIVFINCSGFPVYNLNKEWTEIITFNKIFILLLATWSIGSILYAIFPKIKPLSLVMVIMFFSSLGLICRYLLEFGEVSNTYNFTLANIVLHLGLFTIFTFLSWFIFLRKYSTKRIKF